MRLVEQIRWWAENCDRTDSGCLARGLLLEVADVLEKADPVKRAHDTGACRLFCCSACGYGVNDIFVEDEGKFLPDTGPIFNYCPNCGAKMDGGADHSQT